ncbi:MAG: sulfotransferase, partial [Gammaproteobacteria bacterium]|nr:sulfotransferase [Gammaproteobacteria bacterium]
MNQVISIQHFREFEAFLDRKLFFIVGMPKSGTTWVQHVLNNHSDIICRGES